MFVLLNSDSTQICILLVFLKVKSPKHIFLQLHIIMFFFLSIYLPFCFFELFKFCLNVPLHFLPCLFTFTSPPNNPINQGSQQIFKQEVITDKVGGSSAKPEVSKQSKEKRLKHKVSGYKSQSKRRSIARCRLLLRTLINVSSSGTRLSLFSEVSHCR